MLPALRSIARNPAFTALASLVLATGISANTIIFTFVHAMLIGPLPYRDSSRLAMLSEYNRGREPLSADFAFNQAASAADFFDWKREADTFEALKAFLYRTDPMDLPTLGHGRYTWFRGGSRKLFPREESGAPMTVLRTE